MLYNGTVYGGGETPYMQMVNRGKFKTTWNIYTKTQKDMGGGAFSIEWKTFGQSSGLISVDIDWGLFGDAVAIGCVQARQIVVKVRVDTDITITGSISLNSRITSLVSGQTSDDIHMGQFYVSKRKRVDNIVELTCYDEMLKTQGDFFTNGADIGSWPQGMKAVAGQIANRIGCNLNIPSGLPDYQMEAPVGMSMREVLASMAAAWGGNWTCRAEGLTGSHTPKSTLTLVPLGSSLGTYTAGKKAAGMTAIGGSVKFSGVRMFWSDTDCFESGYCTNNKTTLECYCEWATQEMADNVMAAINGKSFQAFEASNAWLHPAVEPGDAIVINGITSQIVTMKGSVNAGWAFDIGFPGAESDEDEYPYEGPVTKTLAKKVSLGRAYYGTTISREQGLTVKRSDGKSEAIFNSDIFSMRAKDSSGQMVDCIFFDALAQLYRIRGQVEIDGALVTQNLYANEGDIVALTVDRLLTSQKIKKYLQNDPSPDNYISIQENRAKWISAVVKKDSSGEPIVTQHKDKDGNLLFWKDDVTNAQIVDGHYEIDGKRVTTTTENTGWQVQVFDYEEAQAMQLTFYDDMPAIVLGGGATNANSTGLIMKTESGVLISYTTKDGKQLYVKLDDSGRIICKDALTSVDLRNLDNGTFTMTYDGKPVTYGFEETAAGYKLTKPNGEGVVTFAT